MREKISSVRERERGVGRRRGRMTEEQIHKHEERKKGARDSRQKNREREREGGG